MKDSDDQMDIGVTESDKSNKRKRKNLEENVQDLRGSLLTPTRLELLQKFISSLDHEGQNDLHNFISQVTELEIKNKILEDQLSKSQEEKTAKQQKISVQEEVIHNYKCTYISKEEEMLKILEGSKNSKEGKRTSSEIHPYENDGSNKSKSLEPTKNNESLDKSLAIRFIQYLDSGQFKALQEILEKTAYQMPRIERLIDKYKESNKIKSLIIKYGEESEEVKYLIEKYKNSEEITYIKENYMSKFATYYKNAAFGWACSEANVEAMKFTANILKNRLIDAIRTNIYTPIDLFVQALIPNEENNYVYDSEKFKKGTKILLSTNDKEVFNYYKNYIFNNKKYDIPDKMKEDYNAVANEFKNTKEEQPENTQSTNYSDKILKEKEADKNTGQTM